MIALAAASVIGSGASIAAADTVTSSSETSTEVTISVDSQAYDGFQTLVEEEARLALSKGEYERAWQLFWKLVQIDPYDLPALRECGRIAHALGKLETAVDLLGRVARLSGGQPDPELHYLRGEALFALGRKDEAAVEWEITERELAVAPVERRGQMWLARIAALRGDVDRAVALYTPLYDDVRDDAGHAEISILLIEAHVINRRWSEAERRLRELLAEQPDHARARELLAWVLENRGRADEVLALRAVFAEEWTDHPRKTVEYARALENSYRYSEALDRYRHAHWLGVDGTEADVSRLERRLAPELGGGLSMRDDPSGDVTGWTVGASLPLGGRNRLAITGAREETSGSLDMQELTSTSGTAMFSRRTTRGGLMAFGATVRDSELGTGVGASALVHTSPARRWQLHLRTDYNQPWRESSSTIRQDGAYDAANLSLFASPFTRRLLWSAGVQGRRLTLDSSAGMSSAIPGTAEAPSHAHQLFGFGGLDVILRNDHGRLARGEVLDGEMLAPRVLASSTVLSYRHYELTSEDPFGARLVLVERSSIEEVSAISRHVLDNAGRLAAELRGGIGYDWSREVRLWRAGGSALLSATPRSRLTLDYDVASETRTGLSGRRHIAQMVLHVDL